MAGLYHRKMQELTLLDTVHVYLTDAALQGAHEGATVQLAEELGSVDPLLESLILAMEGVLAHWETSARTYLDHLSGMLAAQLVHRHSTLTSPPDTADVHAGLSDRHYLAIRDLLEERLSDPIPLADMASVTGLSVSQFARQFKARTGLAPHRYLVQLRVDEASRLLRGSSMPIAEIATRCGFSHQEHLTRVMQAHLRTTPAALRRS